MSLLSINTFGAVPSSSSAALTPEQPPKHLTSNDEIDLALIRQGYDRGAWSRSLTEEEAASNTTAGAIKRSRARLTVTSSPSGADLCAFGRALPPNLVTIVISSPHRRGRAQASINAMCLPNAELLAGVTVEREEDVSKADRAQFGNGTFESLSLGEIAIHLSHRRALERCIALYEASGIHDESARPCLIMEDDFRLTGPRLAARNGTMRGRRPGR